eukprot:scaffold17.g436.t1
MLPRTRAQPPAAAGLDIAPPSGPIDPPAVAAAKQRLLAAVAGTQRGADASHLQRGEVEEAQVALEALSPPELDWPLLTGTWRLLYSTASDVVPLVRPQLLLGPVPLPFQAGAIFQRFSPVAEGRVENVIELRGLDLPLLAGASAVATVVASYEPRTARSIALTFRRGAGGGGRHGSLWMRGRGAAHPGATAVEAPPACEAQHCACARPLPVRREAQLGEVSLGPSLQNLVASPLLPRGMLQMQLSVRVPLAMRLPGASSSGPRARGINYALTFLDEDMLVGRAQGLGGSFVFSRGREECGTVAG